LKEKKKEKGERLNPFQEFRIYMVDLIGEMDINDHFFTCRVLMDYIFFGAYNLD